MLGNRRFRYSQMVCQGSHTQIMGQEKVQTAGEDVAAFCVERVAEGRMGPQMWLTADHRLARTSMPYGVSILGSTRTVTLEIVAASKADAEKALEKE